MYGKQGGPECCIPLIERLSYHLIARQPKAVEHLVQFWDVIFLVLNKRVQCY